MRIALVGPAHPLRGGIAQYTASLYGELERRHQVRIYSFRKLYPRLLFPGSSELDRSPSAWRVPSERLLRPLSPGSWAATARRVAAWGPELLVFQWWHPFFGPAYADLIRRVRKRSAAVILCLCHNVFPHERMGSRLLEAMLVRMAFRRVDGFLVQSKDLARQVRELRPNAPVRKVHHPAYSFFRRWDSELPGPGEKPCILFFGNIRAYKGLDVLIEAFARVRQELEAELVVAGEFYTDPRPLKERVRALGLDGEVSWTGAYVPNREVPALFRRAHVVALPYRSATQSGIVPLAYQFGVPVIASDVGGLSEVVLDGKTGLLFPPGDSDRLARLLIDYFRRNLRQRFQPHILKFNRRLGWDRVAGRILELARSLGAKEGGEA